jgi:aminoglycoside phosphotransferase (APT) family kinase protein
MHADELDIDAELVVRLPRLPGGARQIETEQRWLPRLGAAAAARCSGAVGDG